MKIAIAQINCTVGDLSGNATKIIDAVNQAKSLGADLVVTPELALSGYPPKDLLLRTEFCIACQNILTDLISSVHGITLLVGYPHYTENKLFNAAAVIQNGSVVATYYKNTLNRSSYNNEHHYFDPGTEPCFFELAGIKFSVSICADFWQGNLTTTHLVNSGVQILLVLNASAYQIDKQAERYRITRQHIREIRINVIHTNLVGGQDERVYDGASFVMNSKGVLTHQLGEFTETLGLIEFQGDMPVTGEHVASQSSTASIYQALCMGVKDYAAKNNFPGALLGLSGGIDSALTLAIAVDALGADHVQTVMMPSQYTADFSLQDAKELATTCGVRHRECNIQPLFDHFLTCLIDELHIGSDDDTSLTQENLQARIRGVLLMALSNQTGSLVLTTGNKSEMAVGYCTLYGDMAGGFAVLKDVSKTMVYQLSHYRNQLSKVIPERIIQRPPSAELRPNQTDQDSLPPYEVIDSIIKAFVEQNLSPAEIMDMNYDPADVTHVIQLIRKNEHKRRQSPLGIRITQCDFGTSWHYPITSKYNDF